MLELFKFIKIFLYFCFSFFTLTISVHYLIATTLYQKAKLDIGSRDKEPVATTKLIAPLS